jgi:hypothetical protein
LVASARQHFPKAGGGMITVRLTRGGRRLLKRAGKLRLGVRVAYVPAGGPAVRSFKRVTWLRAETGRRVAAAASTPPAPRGKARSLLVAAVRPIHVSPSRP